MTETRAEKAQRLVNEGKVHIRKNWSVLIEAEVRGDHALHHTELYPNGHYFCMCDWGQYHSYTDDLCAHALAVRLTLEKES